MGGYSLLLYVGELMSLYVLVLYKKIILKGCELQFKKNLMFEFEN